MIRAKDDSQARFGALDGWRGISILLVLAAHLLPLGPKRWELNTATAVMGMAIFFTLSGFLITQFLLKDGDVAGFLVRRLFRILPLAWPAMAVALYAMDGTLADYCANFFFYANWPPMRLGGVTGHFWSLCVEVQFYLGIALAVVCLRRRWPLLIPLLCLAVTCYRAANGAHAAINTYYRVDEILAGSLLALSRHSTFGAAVRTWPLPQARIPLLLLFVLSCHPQAAFLNYARPYLAAALVGMTLDESESVAAKVLCHAWLAYLAAISYALYVVHPLLANTWLGGSAGIEKYLRRPLLFGAIFFVAHVSTFHYESRWIALGKALAKKRRAALGERRLDRGLVARVEETIGRD